jgi:SOS-response transcriptional repressor LexA
MPLSTTHVARYSLLTVELPGQAPVTGGILLEDAVADQVHLRLRRDWDLIAPEEAEVLSALEDDLSAQAAAQGANRFFARLEDTLSNTVRVGERRDVMVEDFERALGRLYRQHVTSEVREFETHLPRYSLAVAAGPFLENQAVEKEGWEEAPPGLRLTPEMFVARIAGRSMEPLIPNGSLCVFRRGTFGGSIAGSRQGRLVLVEALGEAGNDRYTVKRYHSKKVDMPDGTWRQEQIRLEPLNPEFPVLDLQEEEDRYRILAEFVQVID